MEHELLTVIEFNFKVDHPYKHLVPKLQEIFGEKYANESACSLVLALFADELNADKQRRDELIGSQGCVAQYA